MDKLAILGSVNMLNNLLNTRGKYMYLQSSHDNTLFQKQDFITISFLD